MTNDSGTVRVSFQNDDVTHMDFVVLVLRAIFDKSAEDAHKIMMQTHHAGYGDAGVYPSEIARAKVSAVDLMARANGFPLRCVVTGEDVEPGTVAPVRLSGQCTVNGWAMTGSHRDEYSAELTRELFRDKPVVRMWRSGEGAEGFGSMYQTFSPDEYRGKRVRFSAALRTVDVVERVALCVRVDGEDSKMLAFDNMDPRPPISGTRPWARHDCVVEVPSGAKLIFISNILVGQGELYWADVRFEIVDDSEPVTDLIKTPVAKTRPTNLDFSEA